MARHIDNFGPRPSMPREYIPARRLTDAEAAATLGHTEYDADEIYIHEDETGLAVAPPTPAVFRHMVIEDQPAPDRGADFVRSAPGHHITHTLGANMVNPAGHIDPSKTGASVGHAAPDTDENEVDIGAADVTTIAAAADTTTVDGTDGMSLTELTRIALDAAESGGPYLYAYFRKWLEDYKGHFTVVGTESRLAVYKPPWGVNAGDMWEWDGSGYVVISAPPGVGNYVLVSIGGVKQWVELKDFACPE